LPIVMILPIAMMMFFLKLKDGLQVPQMLYMEMVEVMILTRVVDEMLDATPKEYLNNPEQWRFWVDWNTRDDYLNLLKKRETNLGDAIYRGELPPYKGIPVEYVPLLARATTENNGCGRVAILGFPNNFAWGVFHQVGIEREREAKERRTDFVLTLEADAKFEDENATTVAYIEGTNPES